MLKYLKGLIDVILIITLLGIALIYLTGGKISNLNNIKFRKSASVLVILLAIEWIAKNGVYNSNQDISYFFTWLLPRLSKVIALALILVLGAHRYLKHMNIIHTGVILNGLPILFNGGKMPVSENALINLGMKDTLLVLEKNLMFNHTLITENTRFKILSDIIPLKYPYPNVISIGDIFIILGIMLFIVYHSKEEDDQNG